METKKRLFEIFAKVNKLPLNEQDDLDASEAWDNFYDKVEEDVTDWFAGNPKMFREGIPNELLVYKFPSQSRTIIRKEDKLVIKGKLFQGNMGKNGFQIIEMEAKHYYNSTLKCGR